MGTLSEKTKAFLFARWIAMIYADEKEGGLSILNTKDGHWYKQQLEYFEFNIYPNMKKSGTVSETRSFLNDLNNKI
jgi:hypothetical protein